MSVTKMSITNVSFTKMSWIRDIYITFVVLAFGKYHPQLLTARQAYTKRCFLSYLFGFRQICFKLNDVADT